MLKHRTLEHRFVKHVPENVEPGVLYVSMEYGTVVHRCCCGCGEEVVTPLTPTDWKLIFDGETVSLWPSVGSWTLKCRSHYIVEEGRVREAPAWSEEKIAGERRRDRAAKARFYDTREPLAEVPTPQESQPQTVATERLNVWQRLSRWWTA